jgi:hypothetical protein
LRGIFAKKIFTRLSPRIRAAREYASEFDMRIGGVVHRRSLTAFPIFSNKLLDLIALDVVGFQTFFSVIAALDPAIRETTVACS